MTELQTGHPCIGKNCKDCETCIFDEDLFADRVQPNKKINTMSTKLCNLCINLEKSFELRTEGRFDAACKAMTYNAFGVSRARRIDYNLSPRQDIVCPSWCPLNPNNKHMELPSPSQSITSIPSTNIEELKKKPVNMLTYSEKRELLKELPKHIEWDGIEEKKLYVIPKIMNQPRKIVKVTSKTSSVCVCHEINENTGNEYSYTCNIYPSDLDAVFITEYHKF